MSGTVRALDGLKFYNAGLESGMSEIYFLTPFLIDPNDRRTF